MHKARRSHSMRRVAAISTVETDSGVVLSGSYASLFRSSIGRREIRTWILNVDRSSDSGARVDVNVCQPKFNRALPAEKMKEHSNALTARQHARHHRLQSFKDASRNMNCIADIRSGWDMADTLRSEELSQFLDSAVRNGGPMIAKVNDRTHSARVLNEAQVLAPVKSRKQIAWKQTFHRGDRSAPRRTHETYPRKENIDIAFAEKPQMRGRNVFVLRLRTHAEPRHRACRRRRDTGMG